VLLAAAEWGPAAGAKPPDLPKKTENECRDQPDPCDGSHGSFSVGIDIIQGGIGFEMKAAAAGKPARNWKGYIPLPGLFPGLQHFVGLPYVPVGYFVKSTGAAEDSADNPFMCTPPPPCVPPCAGRSQQPPPGNADVWSPFWYLYQLAPPDPSPEGAKPADAGITCPYLKQGAEKNKPAPVDAASLENSVLEKLDQLEEAGRILRRADSYRKAGDNAAASKLYRKVQRLCPGSRYDRIAASRLPQRAAAGGAATRE